MTFCGRKEGIKFMMDWIKLEKDIELEREKVSSAEEMEWRTSILEHEKVQESDSNLIFSVFGVSSRRMQMQASEN